MKGKIGMLWVALALLCGCAGAPGPTPTPSAAPVHTPEPAPPSPSVRVRTDYSKLAPAEPRPPVEVVERRWYGAYTDHLIPRDDYGPLAAYPGAFLRGGMCEYDGYSYGLMTEDGKIVVDPVYAGVSHLHAASSGQDLLILNRPVTVPTEYEWDETTARYAIAAGDGSWCTEFLYTNLASDGHDLLLVEEAGITLLGLDHAGERHYSWSDLGFSGEERPPWAEDRHNNDTRIYWSDGVLNLDWDGRSFDTRTGTVWTQDGMSVPGAFREGLAPAYQTGAGYGYVDEAGNWVIPPQYIGAEPFYNGRAVVKPKYGRFALIDRAGGTLLEGKGNLLRFELPTGDWFLLENSSWRIEAAYGQDLQPAELPRDAEIKTAGEGWISWREGESRVLLRGEERHVLPGWGEWVSVTGGLAVLRDQETAALCRTDGTALIQPELYTELRVEAAPDGTPRVLGLRENIWYLMEADGSDPVRLDAGELEPGLLLTLTDWDRAAVFDWTGKCLFRRPLGDPGED